MDLNKLLTAGTWMTVYGIEGVEGLEPFRLKIAPWDPTPFLGEAPSNERMVEAVMDLIVGWDLRDGDKEAEFNSQTKQVLRRIIFRRVVTETGEIGRILHDAIMETAAGPGRSKNSGPISNGSPTGAEGRDLKS